MKKLLFLTLLLFIIGCSSSIDEVVYPAGEGETVEINMIAKQWSFEPSTITVNEGDTVLLHIESTDVTHGISIPEFEVYENLIPGETVDIQFVADKKGTFTFSCSVYCGSGHNYMTGQLIVN